VDNFFVQPLDGSPGRQVTDFTSEELPTIRPASCWEAGSMPRSNDCLTRPLLPDAGDETIFHLRHIGRIPGQFRAQRALLQHCPLRKQDQENQF